MERVRYGLIHGTCTIWINTWNVYDMDNHEACKVQHIDITNVHQITLSSVYLVNPNSPPLVPRRLRPNDSGADKVRFLIPASPRTRLRLPGVRAAVHCRPALRTGVAVWTLPLRRAEAPMPLESPS